MKTATPIVEPIISGEIKHSVLCDKTTFIIRRVSELNILKVNIFTKLVKFLRNIFIFVR